MYKENNSVMNNTTGKNTILFVHHGFGIGGASINLRDTVKSFENKGYNLIVLFLQNSDATKLFSDIDCKVVISKFPIYYFYHMSKWVRFWQLHKLCIQFISFLFHFTFVSRYYLRKLKPDIVYLNSSVLTDWCLSCKFLGIKNVLNVQETIAAGYFGWRKNLIKAIITQCTSRVFFISEFNRLSLVTDEFYNYNIVYNTLEKSVGKMNYVPFSEKKYDFIYLGGDSYIKGWDYILILLESNLPFKMCIAGALTKEENIKLLLSDPRIVYFGVVADATHLISEAKFLLSPFTEAHFSRPIMEAYYCGTIPIASDLAGVSEQLEDKFTGILFGSNPQSFLRAIKYAKSIDKVDYNQFIINSEGFRFKFSVDNNKNIIFDVIKNIFEKNERVY